MLEMRWPGALVFNARSQVPHFVGTPKKVELMRADLQAKIDEAIAQVEAEKPRPAPEMLKATEKIGISTQREGDIVVTEIFNRK